jgi:hypothetical protein
MQLNSNRSGSSGGGQPSLRGKSTGASGSPRRLGASPDHPHSQQAVAGEQVQGGGEADSRGLPTAPAGAQRWSGEAEAAAEEGSQASRAGQITHPKGPLKAKRRRRVNKDVKPDWAGAWE